MKQIFSIIAFALLLGSLSLKSQQPAYKEFLAGIKKYDLAKLWYNDSRTSVNKNIEATLPEPLGFIGETYQRFFVHYNTVSRCKTNPCQYHIKGKTMVRNTIRNFSGSITIKMAGIYLKQFDYRYRQGFVICDLHFKEDSTQTATGIFTGTLSTNFYLDEADHIQYDDLLFGADLYFNNQCEANWTSYTTNKSKKVNWGDYRIPGNTGFDIGDGEFMIDDKYVKNGWQNFKASRSDDPENAATKKAERAEAIEWWK